jgi:VIT1/CCC1 family predicted Fe2+/Mn2+ transporter
MTSSNEWNPKTQASRPADITESIHRVIAWIYGVIGALIVLFCVANGHPQWSVAAALAVFFGAVVGLHGALAAGARRRSGMAKAGSMVVGILMLLGFPIGTIVGGMLIYNAAQSWPPAHKGPATPAGPDMRLL